MGEVRGKLRIQLVLTGIGNLLPASFVCLQGGPGLLKQKVRREAGRFAEERAKVTLKSGFAEALVQPS